MPAKRTAKKTAAKNKGGRPSTKTPVKMKALCLEICDGHSLRRAAAAIGEPESTVRGWVTTEGTAGFRAYEKALTAREKIWLKNLAVEDKWQRWAWMLERTNAEDWADKTKQRIEHSGAVNVNVIRFGEGDRGGGNRSGK